MRTDITSSTNRRPDEGRRPVYAEVGRAYPDAGRDGVRRSERRGTSLPAERLPFSNRKIQELESDLTYRKQTNRPRSNRKFAIRRGSQSRASNASRGISLASEPSTRHCCRVESPAIHSKQTIGVAATRHWN